MSRSHLSPPLLKPFPRLEGPCSLCSNPFPSFDAPQCCRRCNAAWHFCLKHTSRHPPLCSQSPLPTPVLIFLIKLSYHDAFTCLFLHLGAPSLACESLSSAFPAPSAWQIINTHERFCSMEMNPSAIPPPHLLTPSLDSSAETLTVSSLRGSLRVSVGLGDDINTTRFGAVLLTQ